MPRALKLWPLLTGTQRYEKIVSTRNRGQGIYIDAPILAFLIETPHGRILYDVGCDYRKIATPELRRRFFDPMRPVFEPPQMSEEQRIPRYLDRLGLTAKDIDVIFLGHLHFDHAGLAAGVRALLTPGHTAGHMSLLIELPRGRPVVLCGDAADLQENLDDEVAPGFCWNDNETLALQSIRRLKSLARSEGAELWPNHDFTFFRGLAAFPAWRD